MGKYRGEGNGMEERVMQQAWALKLFDPFDLRTTEGEPLRLRRMGSHNHDQGPDFLDAVIEVDGIDHYGDVELHTDSREWNRHGHDKDARYNRVVLHVVMDPEPVAAYRVEGSRIPTLSLAGRITPALAAKAGRQLELGATMPCASFAGWLSEEEKTLLMGEAGGLRSNAKIKQIRDALARHKGDWEGALWEELLATLGGPVNKESFREIAQMLPYSTLRHYLHRPLQCEALLFGGAGMLAGSGRDAYEGRLKVEWEFLAGKHRLQVPLGPLRLHRMRPASFPAFRLAQAAELLAGLGPLSLLLQARGGEAFLAREIAASSYWRRHKDFGEVGNMGSKNLGKQLKETMFLNVVLPFQALYDEWHGRGDAVETLSRSWVEHQAENNRIVRKFGGLGWRAQSALHTQGMVHLYKHKCGEFGCLECPIGRAVLAWGQDHRGTGLAVAEEGALYGGDEHLGEAHCQVRERGVNLPTKSGAYD